jgi:hypothetical protein
MALRLSVSPRRAVLVDLDEHVHQFIRGFDAGRYPELVRENDDELSNSKEILTVREAGNSCR